MGSLLMLFSLMYFSRIEEVVFWKLSDDIRILKNKCVLGGRFKIGKFGYRIMVRVNIVIGVN